MQGLMKAAKSGSCIPSPHEGYGIPFLCFVSVLEWLVAGGLVITGQRNLICTSGKDFLLLIARDVIPDVQVLSRSWYDVDLCVSAFEIFPPIRSNSKRSFSRAKR